MKRRRIKANIQGLSSARNSIKCSQARIRNSYLTSLLSQFCHIADVHRVISNCVVVSPPELVSVQFTRTIRVRYSYIRLPMFRIKLLGGYLLSRAHKVFIHKFLVALAS